MLLITLALVLGFDFWGQNQLQTMASEGLTLTEQAYAAVQREDWEGAREAAARLQKDYLDKETLLSILVAHDQIELIQSAVLHFSTVANREDKTLALMEIDTLRQEYTNLTDHVAVNWKNIIAAPPTIPLLPL